MRIAIVNERWTAGATRCARDLERGLGVRHEVTYFPGRKRLTAGEQMDALAVFRPDVVHLHSFYGDLPYDFLGQVANRYPTVFTPHDPRPIGSTHLPCWNCEEYVSCFHCPMVGRLKRYTYLKHEYFRARQHKRSIHSRLPRSTTVVCVSDWMRSRVLRTEMARLRVERIHNGVDLSLYRRDDHARRALGVPAGAKVLTFVAHHSGWTADVRKGAHVLAQALAEIVIPRFPELIVLAVGGGMIPNLPNVRPIGFVSPENVSRYYSAADVFVAPSLGDNLPYTILEAMGCAVPVVASRVGGIPEEIQDGVTGRIFAPGAWRELGEVIVDLLENPNGAAAMGQAGRQRVEQMFEMSNFVRQYEDLFTSVANGRVSEHGG